LSPLAALVAAPAFLLAALSGHPQQSQLELHYAMAPLALAWVAAVLGLERVARSGGSRWAPVRLRSPSVAPVAGAIVLACGIATFVMWSPYSPRTEHYAPEAAHRAVLTDALALIPAGVPVSAQNTILPHLSQRERIFEFPNLHDADYVIVDPSLPVTGQARAAGYDGTIAALPGRGYELIFDRDGVNVFRRTQ
jgi:uncharacterized membrane protein